MYLSQTSDAYNIVKTKQNQRFRDQRGYMSNHCGHQSFFHIVKHQLLADKAEKNQPETYLTLL